MRGQDVACCGIGLKTAEGAHCEATSVYRETVVRATYDVVTMKQMGQSREKFRPTAVILKHQCK